MKLIAGFSSYTVNEVCGPISFLGGRGGGGGGAVMYNGKERRAGHEGKVKGPQIFFPCSLLAKPSNG